MLKKDAKIAELIEAKDTTIAELTARIEAAEGVVEEKLEIIKGLEASVAEKDAQIEAFETSHAEAIEAKDAEISELSAAKDESAAKIEELEAKLANPPAAYQHATEGKDGAVAEGGEGEEKSYWQKYHSITDLKEQRRFWLAHQKELQDEQRNSAK